MLLSNEYKDRLKNYLLESDNRKLTATYISIANAIIDFILNRLPVEKVHLIKQHINNNKNAICNSIIELTIVDADKLLKYIDNCIDYRLSLLYVTRLDASINVDTNILANIGLQKYFSIVELDDLSTYADLYAKVRFATIEYCKHISTVVNTTPSKFK